jgi:4a-hydroxytetrahydrobiopterin dehydratase
MARLDDAAIASALQRLQGWWREGEVLVRTYRRADWSDAIAFVNRIAPEADRRNHHPDVCITGYRNVTIRLTSHDSGGITERDVNLAGWIEELASSGA